MIVCLLLWKYRLREAQQNFPTGRKNQPVRRRAKTELSMCGGVSLRSRNFRSEPIDQAEFMVEPGLGNDLGSPGR